MDSEDLLDLQVQHVVIEESLMETIRNGKESRLAKHQFIQKTIDLYSCVVYNSMLDLDPFTPIDEVRQGLPKSLHKTAANAFPNTRGYASKLGNHTK